ncbi:acyl CoA:acetate/3-ketoacid CoA transferase [Oceanobacillus alkalisoli]|uniref:acyl CoA:acetate/3-ketoacid CoA transferase n=1 Tax=Oceanobacillus alkalisoli TaxID=2925113 RepID=UPI001F11C301|nr:CoA-transferase [Oceanobacillus alkalisoli]MCF3942597.1 acyl CoA:acetate/3-ketoacid CoA transferase [Oceanobacillus alkalisoli]
MKNKNVSAKKAVDVIKNGDTIALCGFSLVGACEDIYTEVENRFLQTGSPRDLTILHAAGHSGRKDGIEHFAHEGLTKRVIGSHWGLAPKISEMITKNQLEAHCLSQGQLVHLFRDMAGGKPGTYSKVGLGTFLDPRQEGGRVNEKAKKTSSLVQVISINGEEYLFYNKVPIDVCIIRGTTADEYGNISFEEEALKLEALSVAQATKRFNGQVIVQVKNYVKGGSIPSKEVTIPGIYVDHVVITEDFTEKHRQTSSTSFNPAYTGTVKSVSSKMEPLPLSVRKVIGRRAALELFPEAIVNLGTGIPGDTIGPVSREEDILDQIYLTVESGAIGGVPLGGTDFGVVENPLAIIEHGYQFDYYAGRGVDITFMGAAEIDKQGNVNVSSFGNRTAGCGGFIDITQNARKVVFCSTFTAGGFMSEVKDGQLSIVEEGKFNKFIENVKQITFSGNIALQNKQEVLYVTERAVFQLTDAGVELIEIAPGVSVEKDILPYVDFELAVSSKLKVMEAAIFRDEPMNLAAQFFEEVDSVVEVAQL